MQTTTTAGMGWAGPTSLALAGATALFIWAVLTEKTPPLISGYGRAFLILWALGLGLSIAAGLRDNVTQIPPAVGWTNGPLMLMGAGAFALLVIALIGNALGWIHGFEGAFKLLAAIITIKWALAHLHMIGLA